MVTNTLLKIYLKMSDSEMGASMVEYSLLVVLIALVALVAVEIAGDELSLTYSEIASEVREAG